MMSKKYADVMSLADKNTQETNQQLANEQRKREKSKHHQEKPRSVDVTALNQILERRRREQEQQKMAEKQRLKRLNALKEQKQMQSPILNSTKKPAPKSHSAPTPPKPSVIPKKPASIPSFEDLMRYATLKTNRQSIPKELQYVAEFHRANKSEPTKKPPPPSTKIPPKISSSSNNSKQPVCSSSASSSSSKLTVTQKSNRNPIAQKTSQRPTSQSNGQKPMNRSTTNGQRPTSQSNGHKPTNQSTTNGQRPTNQSNGHKPTQPVNRSTTNGQRPIQPVNRSTTNGQRPTGQSNGQRSSQPLSRSSTNGPLSNRPRPAINGQRSSLPPSRKRQMLDTDDEDDGEDLKDFIVDDDEEDNCHIEELRKTLRTNFRFDVDRYRRRIIDEDDDDLRDMESSYAQIEKEEDYSARVGLQEDIDDMLREEAEKKRLSHAKKRPKTAA